MLGNVFVELFAMQVLVTILFACTVYYRPWRVRQANVLDLGSAFALMLVLFSCAFFVPDEMENVASTIGTIVICIALATFPVVFFYAVGVAYQNKMQKPIGYFICHHKQGAGCRARLLKVFLSEHQSMREKKVFMDSDDLKDMDTLFDTVRSCTEILVVLCTRELLRRPWCIGELVAAKTVGVPIVKVAFPDYEEPSDHFIADFRQVVGDISCLTSRGIDNGMIQRMMSTFGACQTLTVPELSSYETIVALTNSISNCGANRAVRTCVNYVEDRLPAEGKCPMLVDHSNSEAVATAFVIAKMTAPLFWHQQDIAPYVLPKDTAVPAITNIIVLVCSHGALQQASVLAMLDDTVKMGTNYLLVLADEQFLFPTQAFMQDNLALAALVSQSPQVLLQMIYYMFTSIAIAFQPAHYSSSQQVLITKAKEIHQRIISIGKYRRCVSDGHLTFSDSRDSSWDALRTTRSAPATIQNLILARRTGRHTTPTRRLDNPLSLSKRELGGTNEDSDSCSNLSASLEAHVDLAPFFSATSSGRASSKRTSSGRTNHEILPEVHLSI